MATSWDSEKDGARRGQARRSAEKKIRRYLRTRVFMCERKEKREGGGRRRQKERMMMNESTEILGPLAFGATP